VLLALFQTPRFRKNVFFSLPVLTVRLRSLYPSSEAGTAGSSTADGSQARKGTLAGGSLWPPLPGWLCLLVRVTQQWKSFASLKTEGGKRRKPKAANWQGFP